MFEQPDILKVTQEQQELMEHIGYINEEALKPDGFESCVVGMARRFSNDPLVLLDGDKCIRVLMERDGMDEEEAREFFEFNTIGAWMGDGTPVFVENLVHDPTDVEIRLLGLLNEAWTALPDRLKGDFNMAMSWEEAYQKLQNMRSYTGIKVRGIHVIDVLGLLTEVLCGKMVVAKVDQDNKVIGWGWWYPPQEDDHG